MYDINTSYHSAFKPIFVDDALISTAADSIFYLNADTSRQSWLARKLFNEHLLSIKNKDFTVYADFLPDFQIGYDSESGTTTWLNTRGYQVGGTIGKTFSFYTSGFENQGEFPGYLYRFIADKDIIPGQTLDNRMNRSFKDWATASAILSFTPSRYVNFTLGHDKNFIGDGYRSMLLSDVAANYPFLKTTVELGNVKYMSLWAQMQDLRSPKFSYDNGIRKKWGVFHYLNWNVNDRLSLGFFDAVIWQDADTLGKRGFDFSYINPFIFLRPVENQNGSPDNAVIGFNGKYEVAKNVTLYGQFMLDEFTAKEFFAGTGYWANKFGVQAGIKGFNAFKIKNLNFLAEFNTARPYTYSQRNSLLNYGHYNQPLAHPFGANFREILSIWDFSIKRWQLYAQGNYVQYGRDPGADNFGSDIFKSYRTRVDNYGNYIGQGIATDFLYLDGKISYLINPKSNLRIEAGAVYRGEKNNLGLADTKWITFALRSSFRNLYQDF